MYTDLYLTVKDQLPEYVQADYPVFVEFVKAYYEWLGSQGVGSVEAVVDIDRAPQQFIQYYKNQLDALNLGSSTSYQFDTRYLKNIKEIYASKGSEQTLLYLLRTIHQSDANIYYPSADVLRASDGKWTQDRFFTLQDYSGNRPSLFTELYQVLPNSESRIDILRHETIGSNVRLYHEFPESISVDQYFRAKVNGVTVWTGKVISQPSYIEVSNGGSNWQVGQIVTFPGTTQNTIGKVVSLNGSAIKTVEVIEYGSPHTPNQTITPTPLNGSPATLILRFGATGKLPGRWADNSGKISNQEIRLEDNFYYQQFSYDIQSDVDSDVYIDTAKLIHPAGTKLFTTYILSNTSEITLSGYTEYPFKELSTFDPVGVTDGITSVQITKSLQSSTSLSDPSFVVDLNKQVTGDSVTMADGNPNVAAVAAPYVVADYVVADYVGTETIKNII